MTTGKEEHVKWIMKDNSMRPYMKHWNVSERRESFPLMCRDIKEEEEIRSLHSFCERNVWGWMLIL